jgi:hypothetical protein
MQDHCESYGNQSGYQAVDEPSFLHHEPMWS